MQYMRALAKKTDQNMQIILLRERKSLSVLRSIIARGYKLGFPTS